MAPADRLSEALRHWQFWDLPSPLGEAPRLGPELAEGSGHSVYQIECGVPLVGRIKKFSGSSHTTPFRQEFDIWSLASRWRLAPGIVYADAEMEVVICHRANPLNQPVRGHALGALCRDIHRLAPVSYSLSLRSDINRYIELLPIAQSDAWRAAMIHADCSALLSALESDEQFLCHNDLTADNLMQSADQLIAIDWEYSAMGSRYFDVAIAGEHLLPQEWDQMIQTVFAGAADTFLIGAGKRIASLVTALWQTLFAPNSAPQPVDWLARNRS